MMETVNVMRKSSRGVVIRGMEYVKKFVTKLFLNVKDWKEGWAYHKYDGEK